VGIVVGLPRMVHEPGERRDFLPEFVEALAHAGATSIVLEHGYGSGMGMEEHETILVSTELHAREQVVVDKNDRR
jgi:alanine dehydrogenase